MLIPCSLLSARSTCPHLLLRLRNNLFMNDVYAWTLLAHALFHDSDLLRRHIPAFKHARGLHQVCVWLFIGYVLPERVGPYFGACAFALAYHPFTQGLRRV